MNRHMSSPPPEIVHFTVIRRPDPFAGETYVSAMQLESIEETSTPSVQKEYEMKCNPVEIAIISLIEAQSEVAYCERNDASFDYNYNSGQYYANQWAWNEALKKRHAAVRQLIEAIGRNEADTTIQTKQLSMEKSAAAEKVRVAKNGKDNDRPNTR